MFKGSIVAIVTPFKKSGRVDEAKLKELVEFQIKNGTNGIVPCGTTGESPTLTPAEHERVIEICIKAADKRVPIIAGTGSNATEEAITLTKHAAAAGADAALIVSPYYNKPTQKGLYLHFKAIADAVDIPIILYNIKGRTGVNIDTPTVAKLANDCPNIIGVKEASGSIEQARDVKKCCGKDFVILSGDDNLTLEILKIGGHGVISVAANIIPQDIVGMINAFNKGDMKTAESIHKKLVPICAALFIETNPIPVKHAMEYLGLCAHDLRLPLCDMEPENAEKVKAALETYGVLSPAKR